MRFCLSLLLSIIATCAAYGQKVPIRGVVTDENAMPVAGVTITVKGTSQSVVTKADGSFLLEVTSLSNITLVATHTGYSAKEMKVNGNQSVKFSLTVSDKTLDDVVIISALGINRSGKSLSSASQSLDPKSLTEARDISLFNALNGKIAGLQITGTGQPGGSVRITLRGDNSITGANQPLIVVDGVPIENNPGDAGGNMDYGNAAANINPDDIESITVLKGPNGAALYGAKAANGAILITLKKGKPGGDGTLGIDVNQNLQIYKITAFPEYQNIWGEGANLRLARGNGSNVNQANGAVNLGGGNQSWGAPMLGQPYNTFGGVPIPDGYVPQPNNISDLYQPTLTNTSNISVGKSDANSAFRVSYGFVKSNDVVENLNRIKKHNLTLTASRNIGTKIKIDTRIAYTNWNTKNRMVRNLDPANPLATYVYMPRSVRLDGFFPYKDINGNSITSGAALSDTENPYWSIYANSNEDTRSAINGAIIATVNVTSAIKIRTQVVGDLATTENYTYKELGGLRTPNGFYSNGLRRQNNWYYEGIAMYNKRFSNLSVTGLLGFSLDDKNTLDRFASVNSLVAHEKPSMSNANAVPTVGESQPRSKQQSAFSQVTFGYKDFLFLEASARNEWSSTLPANNRSFFYPSVGGSFVFTQFIKNKNILSSGKIRLNYAKVGNSTSPFQLLNTYSAQGLYLGNPMYAYNTLYKNPNLKPEQTISKEAGVDLSFFKSKLNLSATLYKNNTINQIVNVQTPFETGYNNRVVNAGEIQNKGFELALAATVIQKKNFTWKSAVNFATNESKVISLLPNSNRIILGGRLNMTANAVVGQPYGIQMGNRPTMIGDTILVATSGRNIVELNVITGNPRPKWTGGFINSVSFKGFSLQITATVKWGGTIFSESYGRAMFQGTTVKSLEGRDDFFFSDFILGESGNERLNIGQVVGSTSTRYADSLRAKGLAYPNAYLQKLGPNGVPLVDKDGRFIPGSKFIGWVYPQLVLGNDKVGNDVPYLTFDASSIKISEIVLGYTIPKKVLGKSFVKGAYVAVTGRNIWQIYQKTPIGIDPESAAGTTNGTLGIESGGSFPYAILGFTVKLSF